MEFGSPTRESIPTIDEYAEASPMRVAYCSQLNSDEYEAQTSAETNKALQELIDMMEKQPDLYRRVLQRRKREEMENAGVFSFMKAQALYLLKRDAAFDLSDEEYESKSKKVREEMTRVFNYSEGLREKNGSRRSARLAKKRDNSAPAKTKDLTSHKYKKSPLAAKPLATAPPPPPPLPSSLAPTMESSSRLQPVADLPGKENNVVLSGPACNLRRRALRELRTSPEHAKTCHPSRPPTQSTTRDDSVLTETVTQRGRSPSQSGPIKDLSPARGKKQDDLLLALAGSNARKSLRHVITERSPGGTPVKDHKRKHLNEDEDAGPVTLFNTQLLWKFRNANLRSPSPCRELNSWCSSPES